MITDADRIRRLPADEQYQRAVATFSQREAPHDSYKVTFHFADESTLTFKKVYELAEDEPSQEG